MIEAVALRLRLQGACKRELGFGHRKSLDLNFASASYKLDVLS